MEYKIEAFVQKITSPVLCTIDGQTTEYASGQALYDTSFDKYYLVDSISVKGEKILLSLKEHKQTAPMNWVGEEAVSFE
jgi:hypothetical protein